MRILTKKAYRFSLYKNKARVESVVVEPLIMTTVPDWVRNDPMFALALKAGNLTVAGATNATSMNAVSVMMAKAEELGIQSPGDMTLNDLQKAIAAADFGAAHDDDSGGDDEGDYGDDAETGQTPAQKSAIKKALIDEAHALGIRANNKSKTTELERLIAEAKQGENNPPVNPPQGNAFGADPAANDNNNA